MKRNLQALLLLTVGSVLFSLSLIVFLDPAKLVTGGVSGIAILLSHLLPLGVGGIFLILNIPPLIVGVSVFGKRFMLATLYATLLSSFVSELFAIVFHSVLPLSEDKILSALFGGILCGVGLGLVFRAGGTTGGTDIAVRLLRLKFPHIKEGIFFFVIDFAVVAASAMVFRSFESALYSTLALIACSLSVDAILYGRMEARLLFIVSSVPEVLAERLMRECGVGVTFLHAEGGYRGEKNAVILCAVRTKLYPKVADVVAKTDPCAFTVVTTAKAIYGEGFERYPADPPKREGRQKKKKHP
ncbi:MAG: YitT family protein [Clostridia bacterium]|nr:YitT family protein [Clostridia bacterium]